MRGRRRASQPSEGEASRDTLRHRWRTLPRLLRLLWELGPREILLIACFDIVSGLLPIARVAVLLHLINSTLAAATGKTSWKLAALWLGVLLLCNYFQMGFDALNTWLGADVQERLKLRAQERLLVKASRLSLQAFEQSEFFDRMQRAQEGVEDHLFTILEGLFPIPSLVVTAVGLLAYVGSASPAFPLILIGGVLPSYFIGQAFNRNRYLLQRQHTASERKLSYLSGLMVGREAATEVRLFGLQEHLLEMRQQLFRQMEQERLQLARTLAIGFTLPITCEQITYGIVVIGVVALIAVGRLSVGAYAAYLQAAESFRDAVTTLLWRFGWMDNNLRYIRDLFDYLDIVEETPSGKALLPDNTRLTVRFEGVCFTYPGSERPVLDGIDLTLAPGERIALVGENGAGKTTLAKLLLGLYLPTGGRITVNGTDLREIDPEAWKERVSAVFQDYVKYEVTARENIGFGDLRRLHDTEAISTAAVRSGAAAVVERLPASYETVLGKAYDEAGQDLSIGQWQKLAIARAALRGASVLVLDEPTAALDARAEVEVYRQFRDMSAGRSVLFISHRLGSARLADRILFLEEGRIVEEGSHAELMALQGRYARMYSIQAAWYA